MAIYHLSTKPISRSSGRSAVASIAYRAGIEITDERTGLKYDYTKRSGVVETSLHMPLDFKGDKLEGIERSQLWNMAEQKETRSNSRTAREIVVNLPHELSENERSQLVNEFASELADKYQIAVDVAIHTPDKEGDNRNHHAHLMLTTRKLEMMESGNLALTEKARLELSNTQLKERNLPKAQDELKGLRKIWADRTNAVLEIEGHEQRIDHRSHKDRGLDIKPTVKEGWRATQLERMGIRTDVGDLNRQIKADNAKIMGLKAEIVVNRKDLERQTVKNTPNRSIELRKEISPSYSRSKVKDTLKTANNISNVDGQTPKQARKDLKLYDDGVSLLAEKMKQQAISKLTKRMVELASQYKEIDSKISLFGRGKRKEQLKEISQEHAKVKQSRTNLEKKDFTAESKAYLAKESRQGQEKMEKAKATLNAQVSFRYGSSEGQKGRRYTGEITSVSCLGVIQTTPTGKKIYHELESLDRIPNKGEKVKISYDEKSATVDVADRKELARQRQEHQQQMEQSKEDRGMER